MGIRCADHVTPLYPQKLALTSPTGGGRSVGIVRVRNKATEFSPCVVGDGLNWFREGFVVILFHLTVFSKFVHPLRVVNCCRELIRRS